MQTVLTPGDKGFKDGVPWVIGRDLNTYYIGECGGCGYSYSSRDWHMADQSACRDCYPTGWDSAFCIDEYDQPETGNTTYISSN